MSLFIPPNFENVLKLPLILEWCLNSFVKLVLVQESVTTPLNGNHISKNSNFMRLVSRFNQQKIEGDMDKNFSRSV